MLKKIKILISNSNLFKLVLILILIITTTFLELVGIGFIPIYLDIIINPEKLHKYLYFDIIKNFFIISDYKSTIITISSILVLFFVFKNLIILFLNFLQLEFIKNLNLNNSKKLFKIYLTSSYNEIKNKYSPDLIQRNVTGEVIRASKYLESYIIILREILVVLAILTLLFFINFKTTLIVIVFLGSFSLLFQSLIKSKVLSLSKKAQFESGQINKQILNVFGSIKSTILSHKQNFFTNKFNTSNIQVHKLNFWVSLLSRMPKIILEVLAVSSIVIIVILMMFLNDFKTLDQSLTFLALLTVAIVKLFPSINAINSHLATLRSNYISLDLVTKQLADHDLKNFEDLNNQVKKLKEKKIDISFNKHLEVKDLSYKYEDSKNMIFDKVSLSINSGHIIGILGESGSGKSTFLDLLSGLIKPVNGKICVDGIDINLNLKDWQKNIGYITQNTFLMHGSVKENIAFGIEDINIDKKNLLNAIELSQLKNFIEKLPDGVNTDIFYNSSNISGGQAQRIAIARALYRKNKILILDESTNSLDLQTERKFLGDLIKLKNICSIILVSHKLETLSICDQIYELKNKKLVKF